MKILNLDEFLPEDKEVTFGGRKWLIPGELPIGVMFKLMKYNTELQKTQDIDTMKEAFSLLSDILSVKNEGASSEILEKMLSIKQYGKLIEFIFSNDEIEGDEKNSEGQSGGQS